MAPVNSYIAFPYLIFNNLRTLGGYRLRTFRYGRRRSDSFIPVARCICYHIGGSINEFTYFPIQLFEHYPILTDDMQRIMRVLRFVVLAESEAEYYHTKYLSFTVRDDLPVGRSIYIWGLDDGNRMFQAHPMICQKVKCVSPLEITLSDHAKALLKSKARMNDQFNNALVCFIASYYGDPNENLASQIINLEAGFECFVGLDKNGGRKEFAKKVGRYYQDSDMVREWALEFYELRSAIHHRFERINGQPVTVPRDFYWQHPDSDYRTKAMIDLGRKVFYDMFLDRFLRISPNRKIIERQQKIIERQQKIIECQRKIIERELVPNSERYGKMLKILKKRDSPDQDFRTLVRTLDPNDSTGDEQTIKSLCKYCLRYLSSIDPSFSSHSQMVEAQVLPDRARLADMLWDFKSTLLPCEKLRLFASDDDAVIRDPDMYVHKANIDCIFRLFEQLAQRLTRRRG